MDFIEGLSNSQGKDVVLVVIDRLSKYAHFVPLSHPYSAISVAQTFVDHIFNSMGCPSQLSVIEILCSPASFGRSFSELQEQNCLWARLITLRPTVRLKWWIRGCKPTCGASLKTVHATGCGGFPWPSGLTTPQCTPPPKSALSKLFMATLHCV